MSRSGMMHLGRLGDPRANRSSPRRRQRLAVFPFTGCVRASDQNQAPCGALVLSAGRPFGTRIFLHWLLIEWSIEGRIADSSMISGAKLLWRRR